MRLSRRLAVALVGLVVMGVASSGAYANSVQIEFLGTTPNGSGGSDFHYEAVLTGGNFVVDPDDVAYFFDFAGYIPGSATFAPDAGATAGGFGTYVFFEYSENDSTAVLGDEKREDHIAGESAAIPEVRFNYVGATFSTAANIVLGEFTIGSIYTNTADGWAQATDARTSDLKDFITLSQVEVAAVPLPAAAWGGMALFGVLGGAKLRRSRQSA